MNKQLFIYLLFLVALLSSSTLLMAQNPEPTQKTALPAPVGTPVATKSSCWEDIQKGNQLAGSTYLSNLENAVSMQGDGGTISSHETNQPNSSEVSYESLWDKVPVEKRTWDEKKLQKYQSEKDFTYNPETAKKVENQPVVVKNEPKEESRFNIWNILIIALVLVVMGGIVWSVFKGQMTDILSAARPVVTPQVTLIEDDIKKNDFGSLINNSVKEKDYRKAVRMLYLEALKILTTNNWIIWKQHKTNHDYLAELSLSPFKKSFEELTRHFEYVWYGQVPMNEEIYASTQAVFNDFKSQVKPK